MKRLLPALLALVLLPQPAAAHPCGLCLDISGDEPLLSAPLLF